MDGSDEIKQFEDPLMDRVRAKNRSSRETRSRPVQEKKSYWTIISGVLFAVVLVALAYFIYQSQQQLEVLNTRLENSQGQLVSVSEQLESSEGRISELQTGLSKSENQLGTQKKQLNRYQRLYSDLETSQTAQGKELETKADQAEVGALKDELAQTAEGLKQDVSQVNSRIDETDGSVSELRDVSEANQAGITANSDSLGTLRTTVDGNTETITGVKRSLDRDYYNFELQRTGGSMKVFNVALQLKGTDFKKQRYHVEIVADGRRINKKRVHINEPIFFYVEGMKKPYEVLVNRVDKKFVVGYLSVPKT